MLSISENANKNYLAKIIQIDKLETHPNADRLKITKIDFQNVIVGSDIEEGSYHVFFPLECQINADFLAYTNSYSDSDLNRLKDVKGFFDKKGRVRAVKLRGEKSMGVLFPIQTILEWAGSVGENVQGKLIEIGKEFDTIGESLLCKKYVIPVKEPRAIKTGKKPRTSRLVEGQVHLHVDTENFRKEAHKIKPNDHISITYKLHGTSFWVANVLVKPKLNLIDKIAKFFGTKIKESEYDIVFGSRRVVKNEYETQGTQDYYDGDLWADIKNDIQDKVPKGFTLYGECVGYTKGGAYIQTDYDYGCNVGERRLYIYRITFTNADGQTFNLSSEQIKQYCEATGLNYVPLLFDGKAGKLVQNETAIPFDDMEFTRELVKKLEEDFTERDCHMCDNKVPAEGVVIRKESLFEFEVYKLKSFAFLEHETKLLDNGQGDLESEN